MIASRHRPATSRNRRNAYGLDGYPTLVFTDFEAKEVFRTFGYQATLPFSGVCARAFEKLGRKLPPELQEMIDNKVVSPVRR